MRAERHPTMKIIVISPEAADPREVPAMDGFLSSGLERYHLRKPSWSGPQIEAWLGALPPQWLGRIILHGHAPLARRLGLGGWHDRDVPQVSSPAAFSRSCHDLGSLRRSLPLHPQLIFGPVFESITKPGYGPGAAFPWEELRGILTAPRSPADARVLAIGGITAERLERCAGLGFDGAAVLGAVWNEADPVRAYARIRDSAARLEASRHAA